MSPERKHFAHQTVGVATKMGLLSEKGVGVWKTKNSMPVLQELWDAGHQSHSSESCQVDENAPLCLVISPGLVEEGSQTALFSRTFGVWFLF